MAKTKITSFIVIETALTSMVNKVVSDYLKDVWADLDGYLTDNQFDKAYLLGTEIDLNAVFLAKKTLIRFYTLAAMNFGASILTGDIKTVAMPKKVMEDLVPMVVDNLITNLAAKAKQGIAEGISNAVDEIKTANAEGDTTTVQKADKADRITRDFQTFADGASMRGMVTSQLHTSRLSAYGFTAQAEVTNVTRYAINEQLDIHICPVCKVMHKKEFDVSAARAALDTILYIQNADEIKGVQPWPKQSKASVNSLKALSEAELVQSNLHIPPYHPYCRGLLYPVGDVPDLPESEVYDYVATVDDICSLGITATTEEVAAWNSLMATHPVDVVAALTDSDAFSIIEKLKNKSIYDTTGLDYLVIDPDFVKVGVSGTFGGATTTEMEMIITKNGLGTISNLDTESPTGLANILSSIINKGESIGVSKLAMLVEGETSKQLALLGFVPTALDWDVMVTVMASRLTAIAKDLPVELSSYVLGVLSTTNPANASLLAELTYSVNGVPLSEVLFKGIYWNGTMDISDVVVKSKALTLLGK